ncbi:Protein argonaute 1D [Platanthera guangdongensis]|uniref:Protein argonaute 1D n=1 Tax=Platanthera guangdongensis TaxID=2320717 RepID=A0ABR2LQP9_9ASPA
MVNGGRVNNWYCINFAQHIQDSVALNLHQELAQTCQSSGMEFALDFVIPPIFARPKQVGRALKAHYHSAMSILYKQQKELDLLIVILTDINDSLFGKLLFMFFLIIANLFISSCVIVHY